MGSQPLSWHVEQQLGEEEPVPTPGMVEKEQLEMGITQVLGGTSQLSTMPIFRCKSKKRRFLAVPSQLGGVAEPSTCQAQHIAPTRARGRSQLSAARSLGTGWGRGDLGCLLVSCDLARCFPCSLLSSL